MKASQVQSGQVITVTPKDGDTQRILVGTVVPGARISGVDLATVKPLNRVYPDDWAGEIAAEGRIVSDDALSTLTTLAKLATEAGLEVPAEGSE